MNKENKVFLKKSIDHNLHVIYVDFKTDHVFYVSHNICVTNVYAVACYKLWITFDYIYA